MTKDFPDARTRSGRMKHWPAYAVLILTGLAMVAHRYGWIG